MNLTFKQKIGGLLATLLVLFGGGYTATNLGSVAQGHEYQATTTANMTQAGQRVLISNGPGVLGSIIVASSSPTTFRVWNATSTTDTASTSPARLGISQTVGTYTYDIIMERGVVIELPTGFNGNYVVTYR